MTRVNICVYSTAWTIFFKFYCFLLEVRVESIMLIFPPIILFRIFFLPAHYSTSSSLLYSLNILILRVELFTHTKNLHSNDTLTIFRRTAAASLISLVLIRATGAIYIVTI